MLMIHDQDSARYQSSYGFDNIAGHQSRAWGMRAARVEIDCIDIYLIMTRLRTRDD